MLLVVLVVLVVVVVVLAAVGCPADVLLGVTAEVTVEVFVIATGTVRFNCCACGLIVTPVAFRLT